MRALLAALLLTPAFALADSPAVAESPDATAIPAQVLESVRMFNTTEAFRLDPGDVRVELRYGR